MLSPREFAVAASGVPFVPFGRNTSGWDCWGLIYVGYKEVLGVDLPSYVNEYDHPNNCNDVHSIISDQKCDWPVSNVPSLMSVALMRLRGKHCHVGLIVGKRQMLHVHEGIETVVEDYTGLRWRSRIEGFYRYSKEPCLSNL